MGFISRLNVDRLSFWIGFAAGALFWWFIGRLWVMQPRLRKFIAHQIQAARESLTLGTENRLRNDMLNRAQHLHMSSALFSLDEILIKPYLLAPPIPTHLINDTFLSDSVDHSVPYMPDWPEMATLYGLPRLTLVEAMQEGVNVLLIGHPGMGKSVAMAHLASQIARRDSEVGKMAELVPLFIHAGSVLARLENNTPEDALIQAVSTYASTLTLPRLPVLIRTVLTTGRVLLLLDGMDELDLQHTEQVKNFLGNLIKTYPHLRIIATATVENYVGLNQLGLIPVAIAAWNDHERASFIRNWQEKWNQYISPDEQSQPAYVDPKLIQNWLSTRDISLTPLELTLLTWSAFAGDSLGPDVPSLIEAHLRRNSLNVPNGIEALQRLSTQMVLNQNSIPSRAEAQEWVREFIQPEVSSQNEDEVAHKEKTDQKLTGAQDIFANLSSTGLLGNHAGSLLSISHPVLLGYLAGRCLNENWSQVASQPDWIGKTQSLSFASSFGDISNQVGISLSQGKTDPLYTAPMRVARWMHFAPQKASWRSQLMRYLANLLQKEHFTLCLGAKIISALALSGDPNIGAFFRQLLRSDTPNLRQLAALGCGLVGDVKAVNDLSALTNDNVTAVGRAACLALVSLNTKQALDTVMTILLQGSESMRRAAAEALSNNLEEGHPTLQEGSTMEDLLVRRAVIFGLMHIKEEWVIKLLEKMQIEDAQWVVRTAATEALDELRRPNPYVIRPIPEITNLDWLVSFAAKLGIGIIEGKEALDMIIKVLENGDHQERLSALEYLRYRGDDYTLHQLYHTYFSNLDEVREEAYTTIWHYAASGIALPPPTQYGLG